MQNNLFPDMPTRHIPWTDMPEYRPPNEFPRFSEAKRVILDLETKGLDPLRGGKIIGVALRTDDAKVRDYWPIAHQGGQNCDETKTLQWINDELGKFTGELLGANSNLYDGFYLHMRKIRPKFLKWRDVQWAEALLDETAESYALDALLKKYLNKNKLSLADVYGENVKEFMDEVHPGHMKTYALGDIDDLGELHDKQVSMLAKESLVKLYDLECRLTPMLHYMRRRGTRVDVEAAEKLEKDLIFRYKDKLRTLEKTVGFEVDPGSSQSLARAFDHLNIAYEWTEPTKGYPQGQPSFRSPWLKIQTHPFAKMVMDAKELEKLRGTFVRGYILDGHIDGRVHCQFHPLRRADEDGDRGTVSGRFSSTDPNLQNIPIRTEEGKRIRELFIADHGRAFHSSDYSQFEYRLLTHFASICKCQGAEAAAQMYIDDPQTDFHQMVADLTGLDRKTQAKTMNFGLCYGMGVPKLAESMGLVDAEGKPTARAIEIMDIYHERAPFIREMYNLASDRANEKGFVKTILGRRCRFTLFEPRYSKKGEHFTPLPLAEAKRAYGNKLKRAGTHKALNRILQGSNADGLKKAMVECWEAGLYEGALDATITVHDEIDGSVDPTPEGTKLLEDQREIMRGALKLKVPLLVSGSEGENWSKAK